MHFAAQTHVDNSFDNIALKGCATPVSDISVEGDATPVSVRACGAGGG
jgi:hypothetical protein